jgi:murein L,D-transpeptidase YafK
MHLGYLPKPDVWVGLFCVNNCDANTIHTPPSDTILSTRDRSLKELISETIDLSQTSILIEKYKYRLTVYYRQQPIKSYSVVFGKNYVGYKTKEGDCKTPEGILKIRDLYPHSSWSKFT